MSFYALTIYFLVVGGLLGFVLGVQIGRETAESDRD